MQGSLRSRCVAGASGRSFEVSPAVSAFLAVAPWGCLGTPGMPWMGQGDCVCVCVRLSGDHMSMWVRCLFIYCYLLIYIYLYIYIYMHACMCVYVCVCTYIYIYIYRKGRCAPVRFALFSLQYFAVFSSCSVFTSSKGHNMPKYAKIGHKGLNKQKTKKTKKTEKNKKNKDF